MTAETTIDRLIALAAVPSASIPEHVRALARFSLFDWLVCARAGSGEALSRIIRDFVADEAGRPVATVAGSALRVPARAAALANGAISHALDYDDTHFAHVGHPSVGIMPAALAVAEQLDLPAAQVCDAFLLGAEASCRIGMVLGRAHYERGFHQTATAGAFGATVAAGRLLGLTPLQMRNALSLVATRASGLKSQFGSMGKPFNAGIAASNGVEAASLAARGFFSCDDGIGGSQGFVETHTDDASEARGWSDPPPAHFVFADIKYKLHACCHGTHAMLNALAEVTRDRPLGPESVAGVVLRTNPRWLRVCDLKTPRTGLEAKFSYALLAAMALHGIDTAADRSFTEALCADPALAATAAKVLVEGDAALTDMQAIVTLRLASGEAIETAHDLAAPLPMAQLQAGLQTKARAVLGEALASRIWSTVGMLDRISARELAACLNG